MQKLKKYIPVALAFTPFFVFAQTFSSIIVVIQNVVDTLIPLLIGVGVVVFLYGVIKYITSGGDEEKRKEARNMMIYGVIGLFVMVAFWGLIVLLSNTFGISVGGTVTYPLIP